MADAEGVGGAADIPAVVFELLLQYQPLGLIQRDAAWHIVGCNRTPIDQAGRAAGVDDFLRQIR
ncbi:hypothetical protein A11M_0112675 [Xanthomonas vasicola pv. vasculorum NCPPB 895]|nr:hypothetical protein [Xanthomonas vasicola]KEZ96992.1 hypothetical protein A11M_0112675 [Xanthomonas vasicola pv. vasculorum NCPPB 895]MDO6947846.1 hypothetical protein [Xanthomonas vasicola]MDO6959875.1 hypothetical protein [Xanthomonas vasicola]MDO6969359.1 hypothetical protein [Xanthomonas vasicola]